MGFSPSFSSRNVDGCSSLGVRVIYLSGDANMQENEHFLKQRFMNSTAYRLSPNTYWFFPQKTSIDEVVAPIAKKKTVVADMYEQFNDLHRFFRFRKTEWAHIFGVSRVTIYGWLNRTMEPSGANRKRIEQLFQLVCEVPDISFEDTVQLYLHHHTAKLNASLFEVISSSHAIAEQRSSIIQVLGELLDKSRRKKQELGRLTATKEASEATLACNLDQLFS
jgi:hypothetical protein